MVSRCRFHYFGRHILVLHIFSACRWLSKYDIAAIITFERLAAPKYHFGIINQAGVNVTNNYLAAEIAIPIISTMKHAGDVSRCRLWDATDVPLRSPDTPRRA